MDCTELDALLLDWALGELDAETAARVEAHLAGCDACRAASERLRGGARAASAIEWASPPSSLEAKILAALPPSGSDQHARRRERTNAWTKLGVFVMRPSVAMAACALLIVGVWAGVARRSEKRAPESAVAQSEGAAVRVSASVASLEATPPIAAGAPADLMAPAPSAAAANAAAERAAAPAPQTLAVRDESEADKAKSLGGVAATRAGDIPAPAAAPPAAPGFAAPAGGAGRGLAALDGKPSGLAKDDDVDAKGGAPASYATALDAYRQGRYTEAAVGFVAAARAGDRPASALYYAGRSYRLAGSCVMAIPQYDAVLSRFPSADEAPRAALEGGHCARQLGDLDRARDRYRRALAFASTKSEAQTALDAISGAPADTAGAAGKPATAAKKSTAPTSLDDTNK
jgi:TolA-binding protein